jgi:hypothetical protein
LELENSGEIVIFLFPFFSFCAVSLWGENAGEMVIDGRSVLVL